MSDPERQPLLTTNGESQPPSYDDQDPTKAQPTTSIHIVTDSSPSGDISPGPELSDLADGGVPKPSVKQKTSGWMVAWYVVLTVVCVGAVGVFVKGFIDADDVEVSGPIWIWCCGGCGRVRRGEGEGGWCGREAMALTDCWSYCLIWWWDGRMMR